MCKVRSSHLLHDNHANGIALGANNTDILDDWKTHVVLRYATHPPTKHLNRGHGALRPTLRNIQEVAILCVGIAPHLSQRAPDD